MVVCLAVPLAAQHDATKHAIPAANDDWFQYGNEQRYGNGNVKQRNDDIAQRHDVAIKRTTNDATAAWLNWYTTTRLYALPVGTNGYATCYTGSQPCLNA